MPRFAANLSMLYTEVPFLERFACAARDGFKGVEFLFPYEFAAEQIADCLKAQGLTQVLFNLPPGDWAAGERGMACHPGREAEFLGGVELALAYAKALGCQRLHVMAGIVSADLNPEVARQTYIRNLKIAAPRAAQQGVSLLIEPINGRDMPGYFLQRQQQAHDIVAEVGAPNLKVQMDFYHCQIMEGDLTRRLERHLAGVGHVQIAGVPDRHEPDRGEVNYEPLFAKLDELGYAGWIGCEYRPAQGTTEGLDWVRPYLKAQA